MEAVARELRTSIAQELARRGWRASVELSGPATAPVVELLVLRDAGRAPRRWTAAVTDAPVALQVRAFLDRVPSCALVDPAASGPGPERWCAPE